MALLDLFKPKWQHDIANVREKSVEKIKNQKILAELAMNDESNSVRIAAIRKLTDQNVLTDMFKKEENLDIRKEIAKRFTDNKVLIEIIENNTYCEIREAALTQITDQETLADIAKNNDYFEIQEAAILKLSNQKLLASIAKGNYVVNKIAITKLTDSNILLSIIKSTKDFKILKTALRKIPDQNALLAIVQNPNDCNPNFTSVNHVSRIKEKALANITDIKMLKTLIPDMKEILGGKFIDLPNSNNDKTKARCSDNDCPCYETEYQQGDGYLYVPDIGKPIFLCLKAAILRKLDLDKAAISAKLWWVAGIAPAVKGNSNKQDYDNNSKRVVLCCPNSVCNGMVSTRDAILIMNLTQLSRGGMISGAGDITCADCGVNSSVPDWHNETTRKFGKDYVERGEEIFNSVADKGEKQREKMKVQCSNCNKVFEAQNAAKDFEMRAQVVEMIYGEGQAFIYQCPYCNTIESNAIIEIERMQNNL